MIQRLICIFCNFYLQKLGLLCLPLDFFSASSMFILAVIKLKLLFFLNLFKLHLLTQKLSMQLKIIQLLIHFEIVATFFQDFNCLFLDIKHTVL